MTALELCKALIKELEKAGCGHDTVVMCAGQVYYYPLDQSLFIRNQDALDILTAYAQRFLLGKRCRFLNQAYQIDNDILTDKFESKVLEALR